jgi:hypothetical protein
MQKYTPTTLPFWTVLLALASVGFSYFFACVTPFIALPLFVLCVMPAVSRLGLAGFAAAIWLTNQAVGFGFLNYPFTVDSLGWGMALGVAAVMCALGGQFIFEFLRTKNSLVLAVMGAFCAAAMLNQGLLYAATALLPAGDAAFSLTAVATVIAVNAASLMGLLALYVGVRTSVFAAKMPSTRGNTAANTH